MRVLVVCAAPRGSRTGNRRTAERWARLMRQLGHRVRIVDDVPRPLRADAIIALHARHAAPAVARARALAPDVPIVVALTGTDLYRDIRVDASARRTLALADLLVVLHQLAPRTVPARYRDRVRVIRQSARGPTTPVMRSRDGFRVVVIGHLRDVKDPLRAALAARRLPAASQVRVVHAGRALDAKSALAARAEQRTNPRYRWLGELSPAQALRLIASAQLFVLTSRSEGGANVLGEAAMCGTPVVASKIAAVRAALGAGYPALFPYGDTRALARLIGRAEVDRAWLARLARAVRARRPLFTERAERAAWRRLLAELTRLAAARARARTNRPPR